MIRTWEGNVIKYENHETIDLKKQMDDTKNLG